VWDVEQRSVFSSFTGHEQDIYGIDFGPSGRYVAPCSVDRTVRIWDIETRQQSKLFLADDTLSKVVFSPDAKFVFAASWDTAVYVWDVLQGHRLARIEGHEDSVFDITVLTNGCFITTSLDKTLNLWEPVRADTAQGLTSNIRMTLRGHQVLAMYEGCDGDKPLTNHYRTLFLQPP
jgi:WD40 repeat protein